MTDTDFLDALDGMPRWTISKPHNHKIYGSLHPLGQDDVSEETIRDTIESLMQRSDFFAKRDSAPDPGFDPVALRKALHNLLDVVDHDHPDSKCFVGAALRALAHPIPAPTPGPVHDQVPGTEP